MTFLTVGSSYPFDRLVQAVDRAMESVHVSDHIFAQIGNGAYEPRNFEFTRFLSKDEFEDRVKTASRLIAHAGIGSISLALEYGKPLLVMPRRRHFRELVNDHQLDTAHKFEELGHVMAAYSPEDIPQQLRALEHFTPKPRVVRRDAVANRIGQFLEELIRPSS